MLYLKFEGVHDPHSLVVSQLLSVGTCPGCQDVLLQSEIGVVKGINVHIKITAHLIIVKHISNNIYLLSILYIPFPSGCSLDGDSLKLFMKLHCSLHLYM